MFDPILQLAGPKVFFEYLGSENKIPEYEYSGSTQYTGMYLSTWV